MVDKAMLLIVLLCLQITGGVVGFLVCEATHKRRGLESDRPATDVLPLPPAPVIVPETADELIDDWS